MIVMRRWLNLFLVAGVGAALLGCDATAVTVGGVPNPKPIRSLVSLSPSSTEIIGSLNYQGLLRGRTASDDFPPSISSVPVVASVKPDYEKIAEIKPELIIYDADLYSPADIEKIKSSAPQTFEISGNTVEEFSKEIYKIGSLIASESAASTYVDKMRTARDNAIGDAPNPKLSAALILAGNGTEHMIAGTEGFYGDLLRSTGAEVKGPKSKKYELVSPESLIGWNPDILVVGFDYDSKDIEGSKARALAAANKLLNDPRLQTVTAIKTRQIIPIDEGLMTRRGYRVDRFIEDVRRRVQAIADKRK